MAKNVSNRIAWATIHSNNCHQNGCKVGLRSRLDSSVELLEANSYFEGG